MQLTKDFQLVEFLRSDTAARIGRPLVPPDEVVTQLIRLCVTVLQPLRDQLAQPFIISSGWRPPWLNTLIGGSVTSAHKWGGAADLRILHKSNFEAATTLAAYVGKLPIDQLIYEFGEWVHIGISESGKEPRGEILTAYRDPHTSKTVYARGLILQKEDV